MPARTSADFEIAQRPVKAKIALRSQHRSKTLSDDPAETRNPKDLNQDERDLRRHQPGRLQAEIGESHNTCPCAACAVGSHRSLTVSESLDRRSQLGSLGYRAEKNLCLLANLLERDSPRGKTALNPDSGSPNLGWLPDR